MAVIPPVDHPLIDPRTERVSLPWHKYFLALSAEASGGGGGGGGGITELTGDVIASGPGIAVAELSDTGVTPGTYGDATHVGQFTVDIDGRLTAAANVAIAAGGGSWIPLVDGSEPPNFITDGAGNLVLVAYP